MTSEDLRLASRVLRRFQAGPRILVPGEGDNVDKVSDVSQMIRDHLSGLIAAVNDGDLMYAESSCRAVRDLAQTMEFMIREMDPENG